MLSPWRIDFDSFGGASIKICVFDNTNFDIWPQHFDFSQIHIKIATFFDFAS